MIKTGPTKYFFGIMSDWCGTDLDNLEWACIHHPFGDAKVNLHLLNMYSHFLINHFFFLFLVYLVIWQSILMLMWFVDLFMVNQGPRDWWRGFQYSIQKMFLMSKKKKSTNVLCFPFYNGSSRKLCCMCLFAYACIFSESGQICL